MVCEAMKGESSNTSTRGEGSILKNEEGKSIFHTLQAHIHLALRRAMRLITGQGLQTKGPTSRYQKMNRFLDRQKWHWSSPWPISTLPFYDQENWFFQPNSQQIKMRAYYSFLPVLINATSKHFYEQTRQVWW